MPKKVDGFDGDATVSIRQESAKAPFLRHNDLMYMYLDGWGAYGRAGSSGRLGVSVTFKQCALGPWSTSQEYHGRALSELLYIYIHRIIHTHINIYKYNGYILYLPPETFLFFCTYIIIYICIYIYVCIYIYTYVCIYIDRYEPPLAIRVK